MGGKVYNPKFPLETIAFDPLAFQNAIEQYGVKFTHYRAMRCPIGVGDADDIRKSHDHHHGCSNSYLYRRVGACTILLSGNSTDAKHEDAGLLDGSSIRVTLPRFYDDQPDKRIHIAYADRFYFDGAEVEVPDWQMIPAHDTGVDRLQFPALKIEHVIDSSGREYSPTLYTVRNGDLVWTGQDRPLPGTVMTVWYLYTAFYYVSRLINQVRVAQVVDIDGPRIERMHESCILQRENVFRSETNDPEAPDSIRKQGGPESGSFGSR